MRPRAGTGFKAEHFGDAVSCVASGLWFEVHAENYLVEGGPRLAMPEALRKSHPLSLHVILIENPTHYMLLDTHELSESEFLEQLVRGSGRGLLIDVTCTS
jgi:uncharacterized protein (UPF0276 family)